MKMSIQLKICLLGIAIPLMLYLLPIVQATVLRPDSEADTESNYSQLAREGRELTLSTAQDWEKISEKTPQDLFLRAKLLGFYFYQSKQLSNINDAIKARRAHILWIIKNHSDSPLAGISEMTMDPSGHSLADPEGYKQGKKLWLEQLELKKNNLVVLKNAAKYFQLPDKALAAEQLTKALLLKPGNEEFTSWLGYVYALGIMGINGLNNTGIPVSVDTAETNNAFAAKARTELEKSKDDYIVGTAGSIFYQYGGIIKAMNLTKVDYIPEGEKYLTKAISLNPKHAPIWESQLNEFKKIKSLPNKTQ